MKLLTQMTLLLGLVAYVAIGGVVFHHLESENETETINMATGELQDFLANKTCVTPDELRKLLLTTIEAFKNGQITLNNTLDPVQDNWDYYSAIFFAMTVVTTIGYGSISPVTVNGRIFCVVFAIVGIPLFLVVVSSVGANLYKLMTKCQTCCFKKDEEGEMSKGSKICGSIFYALFGIGLFIAIPGIIFGILEDWTYLEGLYYAVITLTTIGFGDFVPGAFDDLGGFRQIYRLCVAAWILVGLTWMAGVLSAIQDIYQKSIQDSEDAATKSMRSSRHNSRSEGRVHGTEPNGRPRQGSHQSNRDVDPYLNGQLRHENPHNAEQYLYDPPRQDKPKEFVRMFSRDVEKGKTEDSFHEAMAQANTETEEPKVAISPDNGDLDDDVFLTKL